MKKFVVSCALSCMAFGGSCALPPTSPSRENWGFLKDLSTQPAYVSHFTRSPLPDELDLSGGILIKDDFGVSCESETALVDFRAFLRDLKLAPSSATGATTNNYSQLLLTRQAVGPHEAYRVEVSHSGVVLKTNDDDGLRRGLAYLEDCLLASPAPALKPFAITRKPWVKNRISRCFFGPIKRPPFNRDELMDDVDYYPEPYLNRLAHEGVNGLWLTVEFRDLAETSFLKRSKDAERRLDKLRRTVARCRRYGIRTWLFAIEPHRLDDGDELKIAHPELLGASRWGTTVMCPSKPETLRYLEESLASVFREVPGLAGLINISHGERATTCLSFLPPVGAGRTGCPLCDQLRPAEVHARTAGAMLRGMRQGNPKAELISWFYQPQVSPERADWVFEVPRYLPKGVTLTYNFESGAFKDQLGALRPGGDYWLSFVGPAQAFSRMALATQASDAALGAKIQVGNSHELATMPFVPVPGLLYRKYREMHRLGVSTVMQCWYFGNYPGVMNKAAGELSFAEFTPDETEDVFLERLAEPEWGADARCVVRCWQRLSDAYANYPLSNDMQYYGPFHAGVSWPLYAMPRLKPLARTWKPQDSPSGDTIGEALENHSLDEAVILSSRMAEGADLKTELGKLALNWRGNRARLLDIGLMRALSLHFENAHNIFRFYQYRRDAIAFSRDAKDHPSARLLVNKMRQLVLREKALTDEMRILADDDSRLGFHSEAETYQYFPEKLRWRQGELNSTLSELDVIDAALVRGETYPESDFEQNAPACQVGAGFKATPNFSFRVDESDDDSLIVTVMTREPSVTIRTFDAAATLWCRSVYCSQGGYCQSPYADNVITRGHIARLAVTREGSDRIYSITLDSSGWSRDRRLRPAWLMIEAGKGKWPDLPRAEEYRLNLGYAIGNRFGRIRR